MRKVVSILFRWLKEDVSLYRILLLFTFLSVPVYLWYGSGQLQGWLYPGDWGQRWARMTLFYSSIWLLSVIIIQPSNKSGIPIVLLLFSAALYSFRESWYGAHFGFAETTPAWQLRAVENLVEGFILMGPLLLFYAIFEKQSHFYGLNPKGFSPKPYLIMLAMMVIPVTWAAFQTDFLQQYPKAFQGTGLSELNMGNWKSWVIFETCYGLDFVSIEFFFRGFLIMAFSTAMGKQAILPMAAWYMMIHMGKPLAETISSFFGGVLLGLLAFETKNIYGGILVHLGIAWLMEVMATLFHSFSLFHRF